MFWNKQSKKKCAQNRTKEFFFNLLSFLYIFVYCKMFWSEAKILKKNLGEQIFAKIRSTITTSLKKFKLIPNVIHRFFAHFFLVIIIPKVSLTC